MALFSEDSLPRDYFIFFFSLSFLTSPPTFASHEMLVDYLTLQTTTACENAIWVAQSLPSEIPNPDFTSN